MKTLILCAMTTVLALSGAAFAASANTRITDSDMKRSERMTPDASAADTKRQRHEATSPEAIRQGIAPITDTNPDRGPNTRAPRR